MKNITVRLILLLCFCAIAPFAVAQQKGKIFVESFERDQMDLTARNPEYKKDGYAIIKVTSNNPDDNLSEYHFNFGYMNHEIVNRGDELWVYVQRNAKMVTITRQGYTSSGKVDLKTTVGEGETYRLLLSSVGPKVEYQMVKFTVLPAEANAEIKVKAEGSDLTFSLKADAAGTAARNLPLGIYTYAVETEHYKLSEGRMSLTNKNITHEEKITLIPEFAVVTLTVDSDADIYVYGEKKGRRTWTGTLRYGNYHVECKQDNHKDATDMITVKENGATSFKLSAPQPIMGTLSVISTPLNAKIEIDGKDYGTTPKNIPMVIGSHNVEISKDDYKTESKTVVVNEGEVANVDVTLTQMVDMTINSKPSNATLYINGERVGTTPYTATMSSGDYDVRLTHNKYVDFKEKVHLSSSNPNIMFKMARQYLRKTTVYLDAFGQVGMANGFGGDIGGYIKNFNIEASYMMFFGQETLYDNTYIGNESDGLKSSVALKLGYAFNINNRTRITPQIGAYLVERNCFEDENYYVDGDDAKLFSFMNIGASIGARCEYAIAPNVGIFATPEFRFAIAAAEVMKEMMLVSSKVKNALNGASVKVGIYVNL